METRRPHADLQRRVNQAIGCERVKDLARRVLEVVGSDDSLQFSWLDLVRSRQIRDAVGRSLSPLLKLSRWKRSLALGTMATRHAVILFPCASCYLLRTTRQRGATRTSSCRY